MPIYYHEAFLLKVLGWLQKDRQYSADRAVRAIFKKASGLKRPIETTVSGLNRSAFAENHGSRFSLGGRDGGRVVMNWHLAPGKSGIVNNAKQFELRTQLVTQVSLYERLIISNANSEGRILEFKNNDFKNDLESIQVRSDADVKSGASLDQALSLVGMYVKGRRRLDDSTSSTHPVLAVAVYSTFWEDNLENIFYFNLANQKGVLENFDELKEQFRSYVSKAYPGFKFTVNISTATNEKKRNV